LHGLHHFDEFEDDVVNVFRERVEYAHKRLSEIPWVDVLPVSGSFYIFPSIKKTGLTSAQFSQKLFNECHVRVIPGRAFGESGEYHIRISCTLGIDKLKEAGIWVFGADMDGDDYTLTDFDTPCALVIGNEGKGIGRLVAQKCDGIVSLPMFGKINSLNASVAAGILMYAVVKSRTGK
jgi:hypothetical protein